MRQVKRQLDFLSKEKREILIREITSYFETNFDQEIGIIAAEDVLDFFLDAAGKEIYNKAVLDSKTTVAKSVENMEVDIDLLLKK